MLPKEIKVRENFLPLDLYQEVNQYSKNIINQRPNNHLFVTHHWWQPELVLDSFPIFTHKIPDDMPMCVTLKAFIEDFSGLNVDIASMYYGTTFSYFPWHSDAKRDGAMTIYLNDFWDRNWGGYFMFNETDVDIRAIMPKPNLAIMSTGRVDHSTTAVNRNADMRRTIQIFMSLKK